MRITSTSEDSSCEGWPSPTWHGMRSRNPPPRFSRARSALIGMLAIGLVALYGFHHRVELGQILDELRAALPSVSHAAAATQQIL